MKNSDPEIQSIDPGGTLNELKVKIREYILEGLKNAPDAFIGLLEGKRSGRFVMRVGNHEASINDVTVGSKIGVVATGQCCGYPRSWMTVLTSRHNSHSQHSLCHRTGGKTAAQSFRSKAPI